MDKRIIIILSVIILFIALFFLFRSRTIKIDRELTIVALGDSLTEGFGVLPTDSYPSQLQVKLRRNNIMATVINKGISGNTSEDVLRRISEIVEIKPDIVILAIGSNDGLRGVSPTVTKQNITQIIKILQDNGIEILFCGMRILPQYGFEHSAQFKALYKDLAKEYELVFMPYFLEDVALNSKFNIDDEIHPNRQGYEKIVDNLYPYLIKVMKKLD